MSSLCATMLPDCRGPGGGCWVVTGGGSCESSFSSEGAFRLRFMRFCSAAARTAPPFISSVVDETGLDGLNTSDVRC